jgi:hypothetical protein
MGRKDGITASARRAAKLKVEAVRDEAEAAVFRAARRGILSSSAHVERVERLCVVGYCEACKAAAVQIAEIEGADAPQQAANLGEILRGLEADVLGIFQHHASPGQSSGPIKHLVDTCKGRLQEALAEISQGAVADLELGTAGGVNVEKQKSGVSIDARGGAAQVIVDSPNVSQIVGRDQVSGGSNDPAALKSLLCRVRQELLKVKISPDAKVDIEDAIVNTEQEMALPTSDPSRVLRLLRTLGTRLEQFGISVAANLVSAYLQAL